jgi:DNA replication protein DnaC
MTFLKSVSCDCGQEVQHYEMELLVGPRKGELTQIKLGCKCEDIRLAKEALEERSALRSKRMKEIFDSHSLISPELEKASFDLYKPSGESAAIAKRIAERYVKVFSNKEPRNLLFTGSYGVGKSHLAKAITDGVIAKDYSAIFISVPKLLTKFRTSYNRDSEFSESDLIDALNRTDLLVLDDLGAEKSSEWAFEKLFEIIDSRQGMNTIYTTNYSPKDLIKKLGERNFSRVVNRSTTLIEIDGENYRLGEFKEA